MAVVAQLAGQLTPLVDLVYPPRCPACGAAIASQAGLCVDCWNTLAFPEHPYIAGPKAPVYAATYYNETSRRLVLAYKHGGKIALSRLMAQLIAARLPEPVAGSLPPLLIPVPLHRWRLWQRGFNQAALLSLDLDRLGKGEAAVDLLVRDRRTPNLGGLGREARERALLGAIRLARKASERIEGRNVILVDDVFTSGATSRACLAAIAAGRPNSVAVACFARVAEEHLLQHPLADHFKT